MTEADKILAEEHLRHLRWMLAQAEQEARSDSLIQLLRRRVEDAEHELASPLSHPNV